MASRNRALAPASHAPQATSRRVVPGPASRRPVRPMRWAATLATMIENRVTDAARPATSGHIPASSPAASRQTKKMPKPAPAPTASSITRGAHPLGRARGIGIAGEEDDGGERHGDAGEGHGAGALAAGDADRDGHHRRQHRGGRRHDAHRPVRERPVQQEDADAADQAPEGADAEVARTDLRRPW